MENEWAHHTLKNYISYAVNVAVFVAALISSFVVSYVFMCYHAAYTESAKVASARAFDELIERKKISLFCSLCFSIDKFIRKRI